MCFESLSRLLGVFGSQKLSPDFEPWGSGHWVFCYVLTNRDGGQVRSCCKSGGRHHRQGFEEGASLEGW